MATPNVNAQDPLGLGLLAAYCTVILPYPDGNGGSYMASVTTVQPTFGLGRDPRNPLGPPLPDTASGRVLLVGAVLCRLSCPRNGLIDTEIPTTTAQYGVDLLDIIAADLSATDAGMLASDIDGQVQMDERIVDSTTTAVLAGNTLVVPIALVDGKGPFRLTLAIDVLTRDLSVLSSSS